MIEILGNPSDEEIAAVTAAVGLLLSSGPAAEPALPWAYRSAWRRAAIDEGVDRIHVP